MDVTSRVWAVSCVSAVFGKEMMIQINEYIFPLEDFLLGSLEM